MSKRKERFLRTLDLDRASLHTILTRAEEAELGQRIREGGEDGDKAKEILFRHNIKLAMDVASHYSKHSSILAYEDLIVESCMGLMSAVRKYNPDKGTKFSTYAIWWCRQACRKAIAYAPRGLRLSINLESEIRHIMNMSDTSSQTRVSDEDVAKEMDMSVKDVRDKKLYHERSKVAGTEPTDEMWQSDDGLIADVEDAGTRSHLSEQISGILEVLSEQEVSVLAARYGMGGMNPMQFTEVGEMLDIAPYQVRQIEEKAMSVLRHPSSGIVSIPEMGVVGIFDKDDL